PARAGELARATAAVLLCPSARGASPCGRCAVCTSLAAGGNPDLLVVAPEGASLKVEQIRALRETARLAPMGGSRRVALIESADLMTPQAQNALLKLLEEPPAHLVFLLTAVRAGALLPTILSRVTRVLPPEQPPAEVDPAPAEALVERLTAGDLYGTLALCPAISSKKENFLAACDALTALCHRLMSERAAGALSPLAARLPTAAAGRLFHLAVTYRQKAENPFWLPLLATDFLLSCWEATH
ncbi:MAG: hypothetical protein IJF59_04225, partial [Clostridia bacterium]|nr:hypothetical protein [Clostridia bacterium]